MSVPTIDRKQLRSFGLLMGAMSALMFGLLLPWLFNRRFPQWPWYVAAAFWLGALAYPAGLIWVYRPWMKFAEVAGNFNNRLLLVIVFFVIIMPIGFLRRMLRADPLAREFDPQATSYRVPRPSRPAKKMENPF
jgi:hypothetical protein